MRARSHSDRMRGARRFGFGWGPRLLLWVAQFALLGCRAGSESRSGGAGSVATTTAQAASGATGPACLEAVLPRSANNGGLGVFQCDGEVHRIEALRTDCGTDGLGPAVGARCDQGISCPPGSLCHAGTCRSAQRECSSDRDCPGGLGCVCAAEVRTAGGVRRSLAAQNRCLRIECRSEQDCGGAECAMSYRSCSGYDGAFCRGPNDGCRVVTDCGAGESCVYDRASKRFRCEVQSTCG
jgi:hypothetical protein